jgi:outer membrane protein OmpA-like peptidoglycan-associated protein
MTKRHAMKFVERKAAAALSAALAVGMLGLAGCARTAPVTPSLTRAQEAYRLASSGPAARYAPVDVDRAWSALEQAERLARQNPGSREADAQAYIALRRAELANVHAGAAVASIVRERATLVALDAQTNRLARASAELQRTNTELSAALANRPSEPAMHHEQRGDVITVSGAVLFAHASADIQPAARETLNRVAAMLRTVPDRHVVVEGYTDSTGDPGVNVRLSVARAAAVRKYLADQGVDSSRLSIEGFGATVPVATNATPEGRAANRRVEIVIQPRSGAAEPMPPSPAPTQKKK